VAETKAEKARRYLTEGRVTILVANERVAVASVKGDGGTYSCGYDGGHAPHWRCTCEAWRLSASHPDCAHLLAVKLIVSRPGGE